MPGLFSRISSSLPSTLPTTPFPRLRPLASWARRRVEEPDALDELLLEGTPEMRAVRGGVGGLTFVTSGYCAFSRLALVRNRSGERGKKETALTSPARSCDTFQSSCSSSWYVQTALSNTRLYVFYRPRSILQAAVFNRITALVRRPHPAHLRRSPTNTNIRQFLTSPTARRLLRLPTALLLAKSLVRLSIVLYQVSSDSPEKPWFVAAKTWEVVGRMEMDQLCWDTFRAVCCTLACGHFLSAIENRFVFPLRVYPPLAPRASPLTPASLRRPLSPQTDGRDRLQPRRLRLHAPPLLLPSFPLHRRYRRRPAIETFEPYPVQHVAGRSRARVDPSQRVFQRVGKEKVDSDWIL
jgi:hypothetical protein